ncbi:NAD(P)/FAD-dependent oxidoreductase [Microbacterium sp. RU33B]|uniref:phytoene desaturase family protein n=1 Tax=Microbacterium sp. RU33B TaxID=1907390 RepID=UPI00095FF71B|nr:NAD(P)/FAD-dependent oxidoreductase [Microbacterium sp. RU33B]SIT78549.1 Phytoene dehydrogenase-related protein [Microbacterium sp. RU33B]
MTGAPDAIVVGSGPNGLAAAVTLAHAGLAVTVIEAADRIGGGLRSIEATLPGVRHDEFAAVHPLALASPFFREWGVTDRVPFVVPEVSFAHALDDRSLIAYRDLERTVRRLGTSGRGWRRALSPLVERIDALTALSLGSLLTIPASPSMAARLALTSLDSAEVFGRGALRGDARTLFSGVAAHAVGIVPSLATAGAGLVLAAHAHAAGWGIPIGGSSAIADGLAADLLAHGGRIEVGHTVQDLRDVRADAVLLDVAPAALADIAGDELPWRYTQELRRFAHGDGAARIDLVLDGPIPWRDPEVGDAAAVHLGGDARTISAGERAVAHGRDADIPYVLLSQPSRFDPSRAPGGHHVVWAYTHVPHGSSSDRTEAVLTVLERAAPGIRDRIIATAHRSARQLEAANHNLVGGDIAGGAITVSQLLRRPTLSSEPWRTPTPGLYLCSASTAPGPGVHGMSGWHAARTALRERFGLAAPFSPESRAA